MHSLIAMSSRLRPIEVSRNFVEAEIALKLNAQYHENTLLALIQANDQEELDALSYKLEEYKAQYFHARNWLLAKDPESLHEIELRLAARPRPYLPERQSIH